MRFSFFGVGVNASIESFVPAEQNLGDVQQQ